MWSVSVDDENESVPAKAILKTEDFGKSLPAGKPGQSEKGYCFYALIEKIKDGKPIVVEDYITCDLTNQPILIAVTEAQLRTYQKQTIIAKPATFV